VSLDLPHWREVDLAAWRARWPNFPPAEIACRHCGMLLAHEPSLDALQALRSHLGVPLRINSAYRCPIHNAMVGGAPLSQHKLGRAFDVALTDGLDRGRLVMAARAQGFRGLGYYNTFQHLDTGPARMWDRRKGHG